MEMFQTGEVQLIPQPLTGQEQQGRAHQEEMLYSLLGTMSSSPLDTLMGKGIPSSAFSLSRQGHSVFALTP